MMHRLVFSSEFYYIKVADLKKLPFVPLTKDIPMQAPVLLINQEGKTSCIKAPNWANFSDDDFLKTRVAYYSYSGVVSFFLTLIKPIKRRFYVCSNDIFRVRLSDIINAKLPRGERNESNAYQLNNKRWHLDKEEAKKRYTDLKNSIKKNGYNYKKPMFVMLNRKFGVKDQLFQGHHRIGICKDLGIEEVSISFWTAPATFSFIKNILDFFDKHKG